MTEVKRSAKGLGVLGLVAAILFAFIWIVAANADPLWILGDNTLSDLGTSDVELTKNLFNYGCMLTGVLIFIYGAGKTVVSEKAGAASGILLCAASVFLFCIGIYTNDYNVHNYFAAAFFILLAFAVLCGGIDDGKNGRMLNAAVAACVLFSSLAVLAAMGLAMGEAVAVAMGLIWLAADGIKYILS